jgi:hypothetical protein
MLATLEPFADMITLDGRNESLLSLLPQLARFKIDCIDVLFDLVVERDNMVTAQQLVRLLDPSTSYYIIPPLSAPMIELLGPFATDESIAEWYESCPVSLIDSIAVAPWTLSVRYGRMETESLAFLLGDQFRHSLEPIDIRHGAL